MICRVPGLRSYDSAPRPPPNPPSSVSKLPIFLLFLSVACRVCVVGGGGGRGCGREAKSYDRKTAWPSINHSILYVRGLRCELCVRSVVLYGMFVSVTWTRAPPPLSPCPAFLASLNFQPSRYYFYVMLLRAEEPKLNWLPEPEPKLRIAAPSMEPQLQVAAPSPAPFYLLQLEEIL